MRSKVNLEALTFFDHRKEVATKKSIGFNQK